MDVGRNVSLWLTLCSSVLPLSYHMVYRPVHPFPEQTLGSSSIPINRYPQCEKGISGRMEWYSVVGLTIPGVQDSEQGTAYYRFDGRRERHVQP